MSKRVNRPVVSNEEPECTVLASPHFWNRYSATRLSPLPLFPGVESASAPSRKASGPRVPSAVDVRHCLGLGWRRRSCWCGC
eukprot:7408716-Pyramimonas_sp.AAC.1